MSPGAHRHNQAAASRSTGRGLLAAAAILLLLLAAAQGYVSFRAQYTFIDHAKRVHVPSVLEAIGLDTGAVIFALLALSLARTGQSGTVERVLNVACAVGSMAMNLLAADLTSSRSITVWVLPSVLYAFASDRLIAVVAAGSAPQPPARRPRRKARRGGHSAARACGCWLGFDPIGTLRGFRRWVIAAVPTAPRAALPAGRPADEPPGETKRGTLIRLYEERGTSGDPRYANPAKTAQLAGELAAQIGYHPGTARRELARYLALKPAAALRPVPDTDAEAVAS